MDQTLTECRFCWLGRSGNQELCLWEACNNRWHTAHSVLPTFALNELSHTKDEWIASDSCITKQTSRLVLIGADCENFWSRYMGDNAQPLTMYPQGQQLLRGILCEHDNPIA